MMGQASIGIFDVKFIVKLDIAFRVVYNISSKTEGRCFYAEYSSDFRSQKLFLCVAGRCGWFSCLPYQKTAEAAMLLSI